MEERQRSLDFIELLAETSCRSGFFLGWRGRRSRAPPLVFQREREREECVEEMRMRVRGSEGSRAL
jgi:hypothetical protein